MEEITQLGIDRASAVRKAIGPDRDLLLDAHSKFDLPRGLELMNRVEVLKLFWLEEVTPVPSLPAIRHAERMPTAGGEVIYGAGGFLRYINAGSVDIVMPDVKYCGGHAGTEEDRKPRGSGRLKGCAAWTGEPIGQRRGGPRMRGDGKLPNPGVLVRRSAVAG